LDQVVEELQQKVLTKTRQLFW